METLQIKDTVTLLQEVMLAAQTIHELTAIIMDYTHEEIMAAYHQLAPESQLQIRYIWEAVHEPRSVDWLTSIP